MFLYLPTATFHLLLVLLDPRALFIVAHDPRCVQLQIGRDQDDMISTLFLLMPEANHTGVQGHGPLGPHMLNAAFRGAAPQRAPPGPPASKGRHKAIAWTWIADSAIWGSRPALSSKVRT